MARGGAIVFCSSIVNQMAHPGTGAYSASKAAVRSFTRVIAAELVEQGIRVNAVSPGPIATPILGRSMDAETLEGTKNYLNSVIPMKRMGEPIELEPSRVCTMAFTRFDKSPSSTVKFLLI